MYKLSSLFIFVLTSLFFASCGTMTEEVWINADGSGRYVMDYDASDMLGMLSMLDGADEEGIEGEEGVDSDSPEDFMKNALKQEKFDTTFNIMSTMPDSIKLMINDRRSMRSAMESQGRKVTEATLDSVQNAFAALDKMNMNMRVDKAEEVLGFGLIVDFDSFDDMEQTLNGMDALKALSPASPDAPASTSSPSKSTSYKLTKGHLSIQQAINPLMKEMLNNSGGAMGGGSDDPMENIQMLEMMGLGKHDLIVHLPGIVKSVNGAEYRKIDENTIALSINYVEMLQENAVFKAEIDFKPKKKYKVVLDKKAMK